MSAPVDHPPPWAWDDYSGLQDANGNDLIVIEQVPLRDSLEGHGEKLRFASPYVREVTSAAGEMETLLRETLRLFGEPHPGEMEFVPCEKCVHVSEVRALLNRLDEARKGYPQPPAGIGREDG